MYIQFIGGKVTRFISNMISRKEKVISREEFLNGSETFTRSETVVQRTFLDVNSEEENSLINQNSKISQDLCDLYSLPMSEFLSVYLSQEEKMRCVNSLV